MLDLRSDSEGSVVQKTKAFFLRYIDKGLLTLFLQVLAFFATVGLFQNCDQPHKLATQDQLNEVIVTPISTQDPAVELKTSNLYHLHQ